MIGKYKGQCTNAQLTIKENILSGSNSRKEKGHVLSKLFNLKLGVNVSIRQKEITAHGHSFCSPQRRFVLDRVIS
ncbi:MAG: hypothetical protein QXW72_04210 [Conexivisphaerales archaeon]